MDSNHINNNLQTAITYRISLRYYIEIVFKTLEPQPLIQGLKHFKHMLYQKNLSDMEVKVLLKTELFKKMKNCYT